MSSKIKRKVAMCFMAHPDDCEFQVAGTLALLKKKGWEIHIVSSTPGDCGSMVLGPQQIGDIRKKENAAAAKLIGATYHCLELRDLYVTFDHDSIRRAMTLTRSIGPSLIFTHSLQDYMGDHEETAKLARSVSIGSFVPNTCSGPIHEGAGMPHFYYADPAGLKDYFGRRPIATTYVDISSVIKTKENMLKAHASQRQWLLDHYGVDEYTRLLREGGQIRGSEIGVQFAEGFRQHKGQGYPQDCILTAELGEKLVTSKEVPAVG
jgi:LmbE family N-acetylglucosaminyl deacetylase